MIKNFLFILLLSTNILFFAQEESFSPEVSQNIKQTVYWGVIVETLKTPIRDFLTHHNPHLLKPSLEKVIPQIFVSPKELISLITLLVLQPDLQKKLQVYSAKEQKDIISSLLNTVAQCTQDKKNIDPMIPSAVAYIIKHAS